MLVDPVATQLALPCYCNQHGVFRRVYQYTYIERHRAIAIWKPNTGDIEEAECFPLYRSVRDSTERGPYVAIPMSMPCYRAIYEITVYRMNAVQRDGSLHEVPVQHLVRDMMYAY